MRNQPFIAPSGVRILKRLVLAVVPAASWMGCAAPSGPDGGVPLPGLQERIVQEIDARMSAMDLRDGPRSFQVIQRDATNRGTLVCGGACTVSGEVWVAVSEMDRLMADPEWRRAGDARDGHWSATLAGIPTGGPYGVAVMIRDAKGEVLAFQVAESVLVGDLWLLAGQSNMQGVGDMDTAEEPSPMVHTYAMNEQWSIAEEPLHWLSDSPDPVHHGNRSPEAIEQARNAPRPAVIAKGAGLGLPFAKGLYNRTRVPIGLVPCAHGGTSMDQWDPAKKDQGGGSLYGSMLRRFHAAGGRVKGVLWYQGESDANPKAQPIYREKMERFIAAVRSDFSDPELPFYLVQLGRVTGPKFDAAAWTAVREDERRIGLSVPGVVTIPAIDLELDDLIHVGTHGLKRLGRRLAVAADHRLFGEQSVTTGPKLESVSVELSPPVTSIRVTFRDVNVRLKPEVHILGFSLRDARGNPGPEFFDVKVDPARPDSVLCQIDDRAWPLAAGMSLYYGYGLDPACNLVDEQDMAVPTFGPVPVPAPTTQPPP